MLLIGLTGGIASGKTLVSNAFASLGASVIDADIVAREAVAKDSQGLHQLAQHFGNSILDSNALLNRSALREIIFSDSSARQTVDGILHPIIRQLSDNYIAEAKTQGHAYTIYVVPLLVETGQRERFDKILVVDVAQSTQIERLMKRDNIDKKQAQAILDAQASREQRLEIADDVINNEGDIETVKQHVKRLHQQYLAISGNTT